MNPNPTKMNSQSKVSALEKITPTWALVKTFVGQLSSSLDVLDADFGIPSYRWVKVENMKENKNSD
jgi:hypothetical protein